MAFSRLSSAFAAMALGLLSTGLASAATYEFLAAPETDLNRVFRLDRVTGEMGACQYALKDEAAPAAGTPQSKGSAIPVGITLCYAAGDGAGAQAPGEYGLVASHHDREGGVFRVDLRNGSMSICYVLNEVVVCTPPAK